MIVIGVDAHKHTHTAAAADAATARHLTEITISARPAGLRELLTWALGLDAERLWAIEDCRHVSGALERMLLAAGERVVRVAPKLMANQRKAARQRGKSDAIDALAIARAAIREPDLPVAQPAGVEREIGLLLDHRRDLVTDAKRMQARLRWLLHDLDPELEPAGRSLTNQNVLDRLERKLRALEQTTQVRICRELVRRISELSKTAARLKTEIARLVRQHGAALLELPGCGVLCAARILTEVANAGRFRNDAQLAAFAGVSPLDASSGRQQRHRLNRTGNRQLNAALHIIALTQVRVHAPAREYVARRVAEGKTGREAMRALKRHLARVIYRVLIRLQQPAVTSRSVV